jgi:hypothetical protein
MYISKLSIKIKRKEITVKRAKRKRAVLYIIQAFRGVFPQPKK